MRAPRLTLRRDECPDQSPGSAATDLPGQLESKLESPRKNCGCYCDGRHRYQRRHYRADIILRPLISQDGAASAPACSSAAACSVYGGDNGCDRLAGSEIGCNPTTAYSKLECFQIRPVSTRNSCRYRNSANRPRSSWPWSWVRLFAMALLVIFSFASLIDVGRCQTVLGDGPKGTALANSTVIPSSANVSRILSGDRRDTQNRKGRHSRVHPRTRHPSPASFEDYNGGGNWAANGPEEEDEEKQHRLSKAAFRQLSRMAFKALISEDFQDRPLRPPDEDGNGGPALEDADLTAEGRRQLRRQQRKLQRQRQRQLRRQQVGPRLDEDERGDGEGGDLLPPVSDYNQRELVDQQDESSSADQNDHRLPGRRRAIAIATKDSIKPDSCRTVPLKQRVRMTGCSTKIVVNHFCYGQCNSFYIPKLSKKRLRAAFESCSVCRPKTYVPVAVTLHCPSRNPPYVKRKIMKVKDCSCMPANVSENEIPQP